MSNRFKISFEEISDGSLDGVSSDPANSNAEITGANVDKSAETKTNSNGDPTISVEEEGVVVSGAVTAEPILEIEQDSKAAQDPVLDLSEVEQMAERTISIESALNEIANELIENDRVIEVVDGLEDIQGIAKATPEGQTVDIPMLQAAANMAVAGTDADAQAIIPSLESFKDKNIAIEAIGEKIAAARHSIIESIKNVASKFVEVLKNIFGSIQQLEANLKKREQAVNQINTSVSFQLKGSRYLQKDKNNYVADGAEYVKLLGDSVKFYSAWSSVAIKSIADFDGSIGEWYRTVFSRKDSKDATKRLYESYTRDFGQGVRSLPGVTVVQSDKQTETFATPSLLGGVSLKATLPRTVVEFDGGDWSDLRSTVHQTTVRFEKDYLIHNKSTPSIVFNLSSKDLKTIVALNKQLLGDLKKYLNESYKRFKRWSDFALGGPENGIMPLSTLLVNKGMNNATWYISYSRTYGEGLLRSSSVVLDRAIAASKSGVATESLEVAMEGVGGGIVGVLKASIPGLGVMTAHRDRVKAKELSGEIQKIAKEIHKAKNEGLDQAKKDGKIEGTEYETLHDANAEDIVAWSWKDVMPILGPIRSYQAGSKVQDLNKELKSKLKELESLSKNTAKE